MVEIHSHLPKRTGKQALHILVPFSSTCLCEAGFSALSMIKTSATTDLMLKVTSFVLFLPQSQKSQNLWQTRSISAQH
jgi:hypothetical protein